MTMETTDKTRPPVFIIGHHRSGTTILYKVLAETGCFAFPTPFHIVFFDAYLSDASFDARAAQTALSEQFSREGISDRFIDDIAAGPETPEEYGFALPGGQIRPATLGRFRAFCGWVASDDGSRRLLLKNPRDIPNILYIHDAVPGARFIFLHRHPGPAISSRLRELRALFSGFSRYQSIIEPAYAKMGSVKRQAIRAALYMEPAISTYLLFEFCRNGDHLLSAMAGLPEESYLSLTYENLSANPETTLKNVFKFLELEESLVTEAAAKIRPGVATWPHNAVLAADWSRRRLQPYLRACGYRGMWPS